MRTFSIAVMATLAYVAFAAASVKAEPAVKPCAIRQHAIAGIGPCLGSAGTTLTVTIFAKRTPRLVALRFEPPPVANGLPEPATTPLLGSGRTRTAVAPRDLCNAGNYSRWQVWLMGPYGRKVGRVGDFTVVGCVQLNTH
ncbi:MAG: hypothetical protein JO193_04195 [Candidatus Eremiobacteraeota bacterium]|nr:hypothetical protein [Candidatus Eremiobacteraeota bacterium]